MKKQALITLFTNNHQEVIGYVDGLDEARFSYQYLDKWTAGQQLEHILRTIIPFPKVLSSKAFIREKFGTLDRPIWDYETVLRHYAQTSLKAPDAYLPKAAVLYHQKQTIISDIRQNLKEISDLFYDYSEEDLDSLTLPHPLLGKLTIREMFYLMSYHPLHHQQQIERIQETYLL